MKKIVIILTILMFFGCSNNDLPVVSIPPRVMDVKDFQLIKLLEENPGVLLDVRTPEEINNGHLKDASFIDFYDEDFELKASWIKKNQPIYIYCHGGGRSSKAAGKLLDLGFKEVYNLLGGYSNWIDQKLPTVERMHKKTSNLKSYSIKNIENLLSEESQILMIFKTPWCLPCKQLEPVLDSFSMMWPKWKVLKINMDNNKDLAKKYGVQSVPTILSFNNNQLSYKHVGYLDYESLISKLK